MASISLIIGILGNGVAVLLFLSPMPTFWRIFKRKSTENFKALPYICTLLNTSLWSYYGIIKPGGTVILSMNAVGSVLEASYLLLFLLYAANASIKIRAALSIFLLNIACFALIVIFTMALAHGERRVRVVGAISSAVNISVYASPLGIMRRVIRTKSVEFMPFLLSLFLFLTGAVWSTYALLVKDLFVEIPSVIGFVLGGLQLALYMCYRSATPKKDVDEEMVATAACKDCGDTNLNLEMGRSSIFPKQSSLCVASRNPEDSEEV